MALCEVCVTCSTALASPFVSRVRQINSILSLCWPRVASRLKRCHIALAAFVDDKDARQEYDRSRAQVTAPAFHESTL